jgi:hypothetical protein
MLFSHTSLNGGLSRVEGWVSGRLGDLPNRIPTNPERDDAQYAERAINQPVKKWNSAHRPKDEGKWNHLNSNVECQAGGLR